MHSHRKSPFDCYDDLSVDLLELLYRSRGGGKRRGSVDDSDAGFSGSRHGYGGDFFYSLVKFQAAQLNHLARLGIAHADYARRAMEALYCGSGFGDGRSHREPDLLFVGKLGKEVEQPFTVDNRHGPADAHLVLKASPFRKDADDRGFTIDGMFHPKKKMLKKNERVTVDMRFLLGEKFAADTTYFSVVKVELADENVDTLLVRVDVE